MRAVQSYQAIEAILTLLYERKRVPIGAAQSFQAFYEAYYPRMAQAMKSQQSLTFILPAFPAKSPNRQKTGGDLPDLGERLALASLEALCQQIERHYPAGVQLIICSDGRVFNDLVQVSDHAVDAYAKAIQQIIHEENLRHLSFYRLDDYLGDLPYVTMRETLTAQFGQSITAFRVAMQAQLSEQLLFNGIHRFIYEDYFATTKNVSKNQLRQLTKQIAYQVIQRSHAWSNLLEKQFPHAIRLSIHPQASHSKKIGMMLLASQDSWATPWHRVVVKTGHQSILMRKIEAEKLGATPVLQANVFSHYELRDTK